MATEGLRVGHLLQDEHWKPLAIISDDAGQFAVPLLLHGLCWVHAERTLHKLNPGSPLQQAAVERVRGEIWTLYKDLKAYGLQPDDTQREELAARFDTVFRQKTGYVSLDLALRRLHRNRDELLLVLSGRRCRYTPMAANAISANKSSAKKSVGVLEAIWGDSVAIPSSASRKPAANWAYPFGIICLTVFKGIKPFHLCPYSSARAQIP